MFIRCLTSRQRFGKAEIHEIPSEGQSKVSKANMYLKLRKLQFWNKKFSTCVARHSSAGVSEHFVNITVKLITIIKLFTDIFHGQLAVANTFTIPAKHISFTAVIKITTTQQICGQNVNHPEYTPVSDFISSHHISQVGNMLMKYLSDRFQKDVHQGIDKNGR
ncbi:hypothetical protein WN51_03975 [Melipona quadrifasciata]|uniref:Uncharacterized protein n=1 Tax=Melipona quadrifasciata TaxID=166423 RepID=A0A0M8ZS94_9HYME|nr:hypothetical protein WN51_03975 [Melipona quadrifasciata]